MKNRGRRWIDRDKQLFLESYADAERAMARKMEDLRQMQAALDALRETQGPAPTAAKDRVRAVERTLEDAVRRWDRTRSAVEGAVANVQEQNLRELLERHYLRGESLRMAAENMHYSERHIARLHRQALRDVRLPNREPPSS